MTIERAPDGIDEIVRTAEDVAVCPACGERNPARARFCIGCGARITIESGERRVVSVLFADLSGFTSYSETADPEEVRALAHEAAERLGEIVRRYGGTVDKVIGDCVMAIFGAPVGHEDDPERSVRAAIEMQAHVSANAERYAGMPLRIGIHTGEAMYAPVGAHGSFTVLGDTVNTSARLQSAAPRGAILIGDATARSVEHAVDLDQVEPITAKGKEKPVPAWLVRSVKGARAAARTAPRTPLVGRALEMNRLAEVWERARTERRRYLVSLIGAPGLGKSRLLAEFTARASDAAVYTGRCMSYGEGITYWPVIEIVKAAAGILLDDDADTVSLKLGALLESFGIDDLDELRTMAVAVANLVAAPRTPRGTYAASEISKGELHWGVRRIMELLARARPLLLVFEDLHWAEPTLVELLGFLADGRADARMLLVASARPEFKDLAPAMLETKPNRRVIELQPLTADASQDLVAALLGGAADGSGIEQLLRAAAGNPLYLEETIHMLAAEGLIGEDGRVIGDLGALRVPDNLHALIGARLDRLGPAEKRVAGHAAVIGQTFWSGAVRHLDASDAGADLDRGLDGLEANDVARAQPASTVAGEREYAFKHVMLRDVAYARIPKQQRVALHERFSEWISALPGSEDEFVELVAYHLEQSCRLAREVQRTGADAPSILAAVTALRRAGLRAEGREGTREADRYYLRALELIGERFPETAAELRFRRSGTMATLGDLPAAVAELADLAETAPAIGRSDIACRCLLELANIEQAQGKVSDARAHLEDASRIAETLGDPALQIYTTYVLSSFRADFEGEIDDAAERLRRAIAQADALGDLGLRVQGRLRRGTLLVNAGRLAEGEAELTACAALAEQLGSVRHQAAAVTFLGAVKYHRGPREDAETLCRQAVEWLERTADRYVHIQALHLLASLGLRDGRARDAEQLLRDGLPLAERLGGWALVETQRYLAEALSQQGRAQEAAEAAARAQERAPAQDPLAQASARIAHAIVAATSGRADETRAGFDAALETLERLGMRLESADARAAFARALLHLGDRAGAREQLRLADEVAGAMGADALRAEIREMATTIEGG